MPAERQKIHQSIQALNHGQMTGQIVCVLAGNLAEELAGRQTGSLLVHDSAVVRHGSVAGLHCAYPGPRVERSDLPTV